MYQQVKTFFSEKETLSSEKQSSLKRWVRIQQRYYRKGLLKEDRIVKLNEIGFKWTPLEGDN